LDAHLPAERLIHLIVAVDGGDLGDTGEGFGGRLVGGLEVLAVTAPWRVESRWVREDEEVEQMSLLYDLECC